MTNATKEGRGHMWPIDPYNHSDKEIYISAGDIRVMVDYDDVNHDEADQVARLIAAAPALLKALEKAEAALADIGDSEEPRMSAGWCEDRAYRVLARVRTALSLARSKA